MSADVLAHIDATLDQRLQSLFQLIRIPSVSTDPAYAGDVARCAAWLAETLQAMGAEASVRPTTGHPMVVGHLPGPADAPHVLFYGHYDVQPADPLELWNSDPFEPILRKVGDETHIVARGASDDKGALMTFVEACRAYIEVKGSLPLRVSFLFEGEEESGSPSLAAFLESAKDELDCDLVLVCDTDMWGQDTPAITTSLRGLLGQEVSVTAGDRDLHSGMFGNAAANAVTVLTQALASMRSPEGGVAFAGFYDDVQMPPAERRAEWAALPFDAAAFLGGVGRAVPAGEAAYSVLEQIWARPSCEINGIWGGYTEPGFKTVIPAKAHAKVSFRLAAGQDPEKIRAAFQAHIRSQMPADCTVEFADHGLSPAWAAQADNPYLAPALAGLAAEWGSSTTCGTGGTIPIIGALNGILGVDALLVGFARFDNRIHSPNEKYDLSSFHKGMKAWVNVMDDLAKV
ncbi:cytosolic nonspecific dipeptidase [Ketogulonicigenium robustum]|uniref:Cytosolic nonspecific dipeptidase n=1 Tax=Ketogulonicigenium robustum TaxID=92947 RepID=A0A1W6NZM9_9RHOB|nr:M20/M25/M40 family metallo-hydrolase [Ketogulonicigenium robustum]ARO14664.1 cytosolic nonspecific dipeptidase [Ketogulonicigenium robustum]